MRVKGKLTTWKDDKGFGFITPLGGGAAVFVHVKAFANRQRRPVGNEIVTYELATDERGRPRAENVAFAGERPIKKEKQRRGSLPMILAGFFLVFLTGSAVTGKLPVAVLVFYVGASVVAFVAYALDKSAAMNDQWRTPESTLHLLGVIGGWPGALAAQILLHHKSRKPSFQIAFWATVVVNCGALGWLLTPSGSTALRSILGPGA